MKKLLSIIALAMMTLMLFSPMIMAQEPPLVDVVTADEIVSAVEQAYKDWGSLGWIFGVVSSIGVLMMLLRYRLVDKYLEEKELKKYKPYIAAGLGAASGFFTAWGDSGNIWPQSIIALITGLMAGLAAVGGHQLLTTSNTSSGQRK